MFPKYLDILYKILKFLKEVFNKMTKCWFDYKTVILSGASSGIGKGIAIKLIKDHGCNVIGIARNEQRLLELKEELGSLGYKFLPLFL